MFCPTCGSEERQASQFCRACGVDLRAVRMGIERPDSVTASAVSARDEIGRAVAQKIREVNDAGELKRVAEDVLPEIEKFLESYEEKRLRRLRAGVIVAASGIGASVMGFGCLSQILRCDGGWIVLGLGVTAFTIGMALILNGLLFTKPSKRVEDHSSDARLQDLLDADYKPAQLRSGEGAPSFRAQTTSNLSNAAGSSVTEHTTHHLKNER